MFNYEIELSKCLEDLPTIGFLLFVSSETMEFALPFTKYFLGIVLAAYRDFEDRFTKQDIRELCPALSVSSIGGALRKMVATGELRREGSGKSTNYVRLK